MSATTILSNNLIPFKVHWFFYHTFAFMLGIILQWAFSLPCLLIIGMCASISLISAHFMLKKITSALLVACLFLCLGSYLYQKQISEHEHFYQLTINRPFNVVGYVTSISWVEHNRAKWKITLKARSIEIDSQIIPCNKTLVFYVQKKPKLQVQDCISASNLLLKKKPNTSYNKYLIKESIAATFFLSEIDFNLILRPSSSISRWIFYKKQNLLWNFKKKLNPQTFALFASVFLGHRDWSKAAMERPKNYCRSWGISHYLARSGLHMVIFIFAWRVLLKSLPMRLVLKDIFLLLLSLIYYLLSWSSISFVRAFFSFILYKCCNILKISVQLLQLLMLVTLGVLITNPMQLFFLDFQLSFGLTFALAWFNNIHFRKSI